MDKTPSELLPSFSFDGNEISFNVSDLEGLSTTLAHATQGDWRALFLSLCSVAATFYFKLPAGQRENTFKVYIPTHYKSNLSGTAVKRTYTLEFKHSTQISGPGVISESCDTPIEILNDTGDDNNDDSLVVA